MITKLFRVRVYLPTNYRGCRLGMVEMTDPIKFLKVEPFMHESNYEGQAWAMVNNHLRDIAKWTRRKVSTVALKEGKYWTIYVTAEGY